MALTMFDGTSIVATVVSYDQYDFEIKISSTLVSQDMSSDDCTDYDKARCEQSIEIDSEYCLKYPADAFYNCRKSCRLCDDAPPNRIEKLTKCE